MQEEGDTLLLGEARLQQLRNQVLDSMARFHDKSPDEPGVNAARLRRMALSGLVHAGHDALWKGLLQALLQDGSLAASGAWLHLPGHSVQLSDSEKQIAQKLLPAIEAGVFAVLRFQADYTRIVDAFGRCRGAGPQRDAGAAERLRHRGR